MRRDRHHEAHLTTAFSDGLRPRLIPAVRPLENCSREMVLNTALIVLVVSALISLLLKAGGRRVKPDPSTGQAILEYGVGMRLLGGICGLLPAVGVALLATLHSPPPTAGDRNAVVLLIQIANPG